jgi:hypothetical protein
MKYMDRVIFGSLLLIGLAFSTAATAACSAGEWFYQGANLTGDSKVGAPDDAALPTSRYSEFCSLAVSNSSFVQSNFASDSHYFGRFYVFPKEVSGDGTADLFVAYTNEAAAPSDTLFKVSFDGADAIFTFGAEDPVNETLPTGWSLIEFEYDDVGNVFNFWVNSVWDHMDLDYPDGVTGSIPLPDVESGVVEAVTLGAPNGLDTLTGTLYFDAYEAHRTTNIGALIVGDANADGSVDTGDIGSVITEFFDAGLASGTPDCNEDGFVNTGDIGCVITIFFTTP